MRVKCCRWCWCVPLQARLLPDGHIARAAVLHSPANASRHLLQRRAAPTSSPAALSKNISMVLENLLQNYESSQLPTHALGIKSKVHQFYYFCLVHHYISSHKINLKLTYFFISEEPIIVKTNMLIRSMGPVSELDMVSRQFELIVS
jgi:hypothetical protein